MREGKFPAAPLKGFSTASSHRRALPSPQSFRVGSPLHDFDMFEKAHLLGVLLREVRQRGEQTKKRR